MEGSLFLSEAVHACATATQLTFDSADYGKRP